MLAGLAERSAARRLSADRSCDFCKERVHRLFSRQTTFHGAGQHHYRSRVALWTKADSVTYFDTIAIIPLE
jgi:hypothetical protein